MGEKKGETQDVFPENFARGEEQNKRNIRVIVGNPPYSVGQRSGNDDNQNLEYPNLDQRISDTYAEYSSAANLNALYDSYIRSIRWASDRIGDEGVVAYVSNSSYIDGNATDGMRKILADEFSTIYSFNLRGNIRKNMGNKNAGEGQNIFGQASMTGIAVTLFIKNPQDKNAQCKIYYHDIGDNLKTKEKTEIIKTFSSVENMEWQKIMPNNEYDWINQRHPDFKRFLPIGSKTTKNKSVSVPNVFTTHTRGIGTSRDAWIYNFSKDDLMNNIKLMIYVYNKQVSDYKKFITQPNTNSFIEKDPTKISWSSSLINYLERGLIGVFSENNIRTGMYRPFCKQHFYADKTFIHRPLIINSLFPTPDTENLAICVSGIGASKDFSVLMVNIVPDLEVITKNQCFSFYSYAKPRKGEVFGNNGDRIENIPDTTLSEFQTEYKDEKISKLDIFYYVYGFLHSPHYKTKYASDLKKMLPHIPLHKEFHTFSNAGKALGDLHINYEDAKEYPLKETATDLVNQSNRKVAKMKFAKDDKTTIVYNNHLTLTNIPPEAYRYIVNGKSAIEWIMDRYQVKTDKASQIKNDPNEWSEDPNYIIKLLKKVVTVSVESVKIIESLPALEQ